MLQDAALREICTCKLYSMICLSPLCQVEAVVKIAQGTSAEFILASIRFETKRAQVDSMIVAARVRRWQR